MTTCARWREELIDCALDQPAGAALFAHLETCAGCGAALAGWRSRVHQLDAGVRTIVDRDPSPNLAPRVLAGIVSGPVPFTWVWRMRTAMVGALLIASIVATYDVNARRKDGAQSSAVASAGNALAQWRAPTDILLYYRRY